MARGELLSEPKVPGTPRASRGARLRREVSPQKRAWASSTPRVGLRIRSEAGVSRAHSLLRPLAPLLTLNQQKSLPPIPPPAHFQFTSAPLTKTASPPEEMTQTPRL